MRQLGGLPLLPLLPRGSGATGDEPADSNDGECLRRQLRDLVQLSQHFPVVGLFEPVAEVRPTSDWSGPLQKVLAANV